MSDGSAACLQGERGNKAGGTLTLSPAPRTSFPPRMRGRRRASKAAVFCLWAASVSVQSYPPQQPHIQPQSDF